MGLTLKLIDVAGIGFDLHMLLTLSLPGPIMCYSSVPENLTHTMCWCNAMINQTGFNDVVLENKNQKQ